MYKELHIFIHIHVFRLVTQRCQNRGYNTYPFLDEILLQSLAREVVTMGFVLKRKRGFCSLHSTAFIYPIVVLGIGWLMRVNWS